MERELILVALSFLSIAGGQWAAWKDDPLRKFEKDLTPPNEPANVTVQDITSGSFRVVWEAPRNDSGITSYDITIKPGPKKGADLKNKWKEDRRLYREDYDYIWEDLEPDMPYELRVQSKAGSIASTGVVKIVRTDKALRCYQCLTSIDYSSCKDPEDWTRFQDASKLRDCYHKLSKGCTKYKRGWGKDAIIHRGCSYLNTTKCEVRWSRGEWEETCNCVGDGCNGGNTVSPKFSEFYMSDLENKILPFLDVKPELYVRYVDDIFVVSTPEGVDKLKSELTEKSVLRFTQENSVNDKLPFLDVLIKRQANGIFETSVYRKPTDAGICLNANSECPTRYQTAVLIGYLKRAHTVCSSWELFTHEVSKIKQMLINNGYSNRFLDKHISSFMSKVSLEKHPIDGAVKTHRLLYKSQYHKNYLQDEYALKKIIRDNVKPKVYGERIVLNIYYQNQKTANLVMVNNPRPSVRSLAKCNRVYQFFCPGDECVRSNTSYIGYTTCTLSRRLS